MIGRCYRRSLPALRPDRRQDLRVVAPLPRLSDVAAAEVGVAIGHVLLAFGIFLHAADEISAREILLGVTEIFTRHAEVLGGFTEVTVVVAAMVAVMTMMAVMTMIPVIAVIVVLIEQIIQETSEERCGKKWQHAILHFVARVARACLMPTLRCLLTV